MDHPLLNRIVKAIDHTAFCSGTVSIEDLNGYLYYEHDGGFKRINLLSASDNDLGALAAACTPDTFGLDTSEGDSQGKAGMLDVSQFSSMFPLTDSGIPQVIEDNLVNGEQKNGKMRFVLERLGVYGKGGSSKGRRESTRDDTLFGTLLILFPCPHEGGSLILRHKGKEWTFNSSDILSRTDPTTSVGFIAFVGDVEHEVAPVISGYHVTLTYNIFLEGADHGVSDILADTDSQRDIEAALKELLATASFLPDGGRIGFGLARHYPTAQKGFNQHEEGDSEDSDSESDLPILTELQGNLKGIDNAIYRACQNFGLSPSTHLFYSDQYGEADLLLQSIPRGILANGETGINIELIERGAEAIVWEPGFDRGHSPEVHPVTWVTRPDTNTSNQITLVVPEYCGTYAMTDSLYFYPCLVVEIGDLESRGLTD